MFFFVFFFFNLAKISTIISKCFKTVVKFNLFDFENNKVEILITVISLSKFEKLINKMNQLGSICFLFSSFSTIVGVS